MKYIQYIILLSILLVGIDSRSQVIEFEALDSAHVYTNLEEALLNPKLVYRLDLTKKKYKVFPEEIFLLVNLNELILDRNKLQEIPDRIAGMKYLQRLSVSRNELEEFNPKICNLVSLKELDLSDNYIEEIPDEIEKLVSLEKLILWSNMLSYFPSSLSTLENLKELDLLHNEMNKEEQNRIKDLVPNTLIHLSVPCICNFDDD